ncbi:armadillo-type protein [Thamnocephalis sphaerospora]|uniref:Importin-95 n=1 Tax=Thamnocephalis sphaerospora TaxID=78915 RepID=A0A4P9XP95_9FUNG|nr:armadillo-type protein [Thamnocephalis sphaerospora]|eukprot:RKP07815.1 armadillo-type protein [Thamnocephalis sphaerospora]
MSISDILRNTLSPDTQLRENATLQLETASQENFPAYTVMLCQEIANEAAQADVRTAAALALKNTMTAREAARQQELSEKWVAIDPNTRQQVKQTVLQTLATPNPSVGNNVAQVVAAIAAIELPQNQWPELIARLLENVTSSDNAVLKRATLKAIGFVCENIDPSILATQANQILTAVVQGARKEEPNQEVRLAAITALYNSLEFVRDNFAREGERNYIMQVVCEATQSPDAQVQVAAFETLVRIMQLYYEDMAVYMEKALFALTVLGMKHENEQVVLQAVEFWSTVCDEEIDLHDMAIDAYAVDEDPERLSLEFAKKALPEILPVLLSLLTKQEEDADDDEWNVAMAAATSLGLLAQCVGNRIVEPVIPFVEGNIRSEDWRLREAAVMTFGSILEGPHLEKLVPLVTQALPVLMEMIKDPVEQVKDTVAWTLGRVCELLIGSIDVPTYIHPLVTALVTGLDDSPKIVANCCWSLMNLGEQLGADDPDQATYPLSPYFEGIMTALMRIGDRPDNEGNARTSAYEAISMISAHAPKDCYRAVSELALGMLSRLEATFGMQAQIVSTEDRLACLELQSNLCSVLTSIIRRLGKEMAVIADRLMTILLQMLQSAGRQSTVAEDVFLCVSALTAALEVDFNRYMDSFSPFLYAALQNHDEYQLCTIAVGLIGDLCRALGEQTTLYSDSFMTLLMQALQSATIAREVKPPVLSCFGDIALATGGQFEKYLPTTMLAIGQACSVRADPNNYDLIDYVNSLRSGILEAYVGIAQGLKSEEKAQLLLPYVPELFVFLREVYADPERTSSVVSNMVGLLGDLAEAFPNGQLKDVFCAPWVQQCLREGRTNRHASKSARDVARWAREMVKRACV